MSDTPEGKSTVEIIESIKDTPEFKTLLDNNAKKHWDDNIGGKYKEILNILMSMFNNYTKQKK